MLRRKFERERRRIEATTEPKDYSSFGDIDL